jgi:hypothetical protein
MLGKASWSRQGTRDTRTHAFVVTWTSQIVRGPFTGFLGCGTWWGHSRRRANSASDRFGDGIGPLRVIRGGPNPLSSTCAVYGTARAGASGEDAPVSPESPYGGGQG